MESGMQVAEVDRQLPEHIFQAIERDYTVRKPLVKAHTGFFAVVDVEFPEREEFVDLSSDSCKSALCFPILNHGEVLGVAYLINDVFYDAFTFDRVKTLQLLAAQAAVSLANATLYEALRHQKLNLEELVKQRTAELTEAKDLAESATKAKSMFLANMSHGKCGGMFHDL
jgi:GAF domain-containing protein